MEAVPKQGCVPWSKKSKAHDSGNRSDPAVHSIAGLMEPGSDAFNDAAFSFHPVGQNDEAGNFRRFGDEEKERTDTNKKST
jgi:hypothetical protein